MRRPFSYRATFRELFRTSESPLVRVAATLSAAGLLGACGLSGAWAYTIIRHGTTKVNLATIPSLKPLSTMPSMARLFARPLISVRPDDATIALWLFGAAALWFIALFILWRPRPRTDWPPADLRDVRPGRSHFFVALIGALAVGALAALAASSIEHTDYMPGDKRFLHTIVAFSAVGLLLFLWLPAMRTIPQTRELLDLDGQVDVRCPRCNYLLIGLTQLRCPECGLEFTIDELIRAQRYEGVRG